jgi:plastocyanin
MFQLSAISTWRTQPDAAPDEQAEGPDAVVHIRKMAFEVPADLRVRPGMRIAFKNHDRVPHTVTSVRKSALGFPVFNIVVAAGTSAILSLDVSHVGRQDFYCSLHPMMTGSFYVAERMRADASAVIADRAETTAENPMRKRNKLLGQPPESLPAIVPEAPKADLWGSQAPRLDQAPAPSTDEDAPSGTWSVG